MKLNLICSDKNSGGAARPRNIGLNVSIGNYILFIDSDDALTATALEEMYNLSQKFDVDVVYCEKFFSVDETVKQIHLRNDLNLSYGEQHGGFVKENTLENVELPLLIRKFCNEHYEMPPWDKFVKREVLIQNNITFPSLRVYDDLVWTFKVFCHSKNILRAPIATYIHRYNSGSITSDKGSPEKNITFWTGPVIDGLKILDDFMGEFEFFRKNFVYRYAVLDFFARLQFRPFMKFTFQVPPAYIYAVLNMHNNQKLGENNVLISYLLSVINSQQKILMNTQQQMLELQQKINRFTVTG